MRDCVCLLGGTGEICGTQLPKFFGSKSQANAKQFDIV